MAIMIILRMLFSIRPRAGRAARGIGVSLAKMQRGRRMKDAIMREDAATLSALEPARTAARQPCRPKTGADKRCRTWLGDSRRWILQAGVSPA